MTAAPAGENKAAEENAAPANVTEPANEPIQVAPEPPTPNAPVEEGKVEVVTKAHTAKEKEVADPSGNVTTQRKSATRTKVKNDPLDDVDLDKLPVAVAVGDVTVAVENYGGNAVASLALRGWVGDAPIKVRASDLQQFEQAFADLRKQLS